MLFFLLIEFGDLRRNRAGAPGARKPHVAFGLFFVGEKSAGTDAWLTAPHVVYFLINVAQLRLHFNADFLSASSKPALRMMHPAPIRLQEIALHFLILIFTI
jgi:hypothetical protein